VGAVAEPVLREPCREASSLAAGEREREHASCNIALPPGSVRLH
jgi:hypothetical protein